MDQGLIGGIIGGGLGLLGGAVGTYFSITNTSGPRERTFMVRVAVLAWIAISLFLLALFVVPQPYNFLLWVPYGIALPLAIRWSNRHQQAIRAEEAASNARQAPSGA